jgi:hypothetical protein
VIDTDTVIVVGTVITTSSRTSKELVAIDRQREGDHDHGCDHAAGSTAVEIVR